MPPAKTVLILGGGINGCAIARELALQGIGFILVDTADIASGATAYSSRLIHGGLRYLEYSEYDLVRESLRERALLLERAADYVQPLRFFIPVETRLSGLWGAASRFLHLPWKTPFRKRGRYVVELGLALYDRFASVGANSLPRYAVHATGKTRSDDTAIAVPQIERKATRWLISYSDAQVKYPERFTLAMLKDAVAIATERRQVAEVFTYHQAELQQDEVELQSLFSPHNRHRFPIAAVINATGAWVDLTLQKLQIPSPPLIGGTKGSHFFTWQPKLRELLRGQAVYAEATDGRPVFVLPFGDGVLVGTTDLPFAGDPATAVATEEELRYLISVVDDLFPAAHLSREDITLHGCGVRPLPYVGAAPPAGITRRHALHWHTEHQLPLLSVIGGKLTTCRSLAEETVAKLANHCGWSFEIGKTRQRDFPAEVRWPAPSEGSLSDSQLQTFLRDEFATTLEDLVERRLMWLYHPALSVGAITHLADQLVSIGKLAAEERQAVIERTLHRLRYHFGRNLA